MKMKMMHEEMVSSANRVMEKRESFYTEKKTYKQISVMIGWRRVLRGFDYTTSMGVSRCQMGDEVAPPLNPMAKPIELCSM